MIGKDMSATLPNFLYVGASKSGSTWIFDMLSEHPDIFVPKAKDIQFFDHYYDHGMEWYASFFSQTGNYEARGECSHDYFLQAKYAQRIQRDLGAIKIIACLRHPVDRLASIYTFRKKMFLGSKDTLVSYCKNEQYLSESDYYDRLKPFYDIFPSENIQVLFFDDLVKNPLPFIQNVFDFLEVDSHFVPRNINRVSLPAQEPRSYFLAHIAYRTALTLRKRGWVNTLGRCKHNPIISRLLYKTVQNREGFEPQLRKQLLRRYAIQNAKLSTLIQKAVPAEWAV